VQQVIYAPFGEVVKERNQNWNNNVPAYLFNAKELDEESGMYYFEARYMKPPTFISRDPLYEQYVYLSPYAFCENSPTRYTDPSGMFTWEPEVTSDGKTQYKAEKGDNMTTFRQQYGLDATTSGKILGTAGITKNEEIKPGTTISGDAVKKVTGSDVLKLDWNSPQATNQRNANHIMFCMLHAKQTKNYNATGSVSLHNYVTNMLIPASGINFDNVRIPLLGGGTMPVDRMSIAPSSTLGKDLLIMSSGIEGGPFKRRDGSSFYNYKYDSGKNPYAGSRFRAITIAYPSAYYDDFDNSYR
jgi:RHS repeat-associated protein